MNVLTVFLVVMVASPCLSRSLAEKGSVVSVYTTPTTTSGTSGTAGLDVYQQIANNIAEKISSPFYRFFGVERNKTDNQLIAKKPWQAIETLDEPGPIKFQEDNDVQSKDTEELSVAALKKIDKKPEKITLYNNYLPTKANLERNDTMNDVNSSHEDEFTLDDVETKSSPKEGPFIYILELIGSLFQLAWGAISSIFTTSSSKPSANNQ